MRDQCVRLASSRVDPHRFVANKREHVSEDAAFDIAEKRLTAEARWEFLQLVRAEAMQERHCIRPNHV